MLIKCENATNKMNSANGKLKSRSEVGFPMKGSRTSPLYSLDNELMCPIAFLIERVKNRQV